MKVSDLFDDEPIQWGLRGDPYLWREMKGRLKEIDMPSSVEQLRKLLESTYEQVTGYPIGYKKKFVIERFKHGGMSSGGISPEFWINKGITTLLERYVES